MAHRSCSCTTALWGNGRDYQDYWPDLVDDAGVLAISMVTMMEVRS